MKGRQIAAAITLPVWKMPTVLSAVKLIGADFLTAAVIQVIVGLAIVAIVSWVWHSKTSPAIRSAVLVLGTFLVTPYSLVYDNMVTSNCAGRIGLGGMHPGLVAGGEGLSIFCLDCPNLSEFLSLLVINCADHTASDYDHPADEIGKPRFMDMSSALSLTDF